MTQDRLRRTIQHNSIYTRETGPHRWNINITRSDLDLLVHSCWLQPLVIMRDVCQRLAGKLLECVSY